MGAEVWVWSIGAVALMVLAFILGVVLPHTREKETDNGEDD